MNYANRVIYLRVFMITQSAENNYELKVKERKGVKLNGNYFDLKK